MRPARAALPLIALGTTLVLTACTGGDDPEPSPSTSSATPDATEETSAETDDDGAAAAGADPECLVGSWEGTLASQEALLDQLGMTELEPTVEQTGSAWFEFDGSVMRSVFEDQHTVVTLEGPEGQQLTSTTTLDGSTTASYEVDGDLVLVTATDASGLQVGQTLSLDGEEMEVPTEVAAQQAESIAADSSFRFSCTDDELRLRPQVDGVDTGDIEQVLSRRD